jgi:seryl-tRNA synthetase
MNPAALNKLNKLSDQLDVAKDSSEATTKEVQQARRTVENVKRDIRPQQNPDDAKRKRTRSKEPNTEDGKSKAAVELGRKGGTATAKTRTRQQRSALAMKAAKTRWNRH